MPHLVTTKLTGTLAGAALVALLPAGAALATAGPPRPAGTALRLTITHPEATTSSTRTVILSCDPAGGDHPKAAQACAELERSGGNLVHDSGNALCTMEYAPVVAEASGHWRGRIVRFRETFSNDCVMRARTGSVFSF